MNINDAFPSKYLKASDLQGRNHPVTIANVVTEDIGKGEEKLIIYFQGHKKGMVLNKTNANNIGILYGPETEDWVGQPIIIFEAMVDFQGKTVPALRIRGPQPKDRPQRKVGGVSDMAIDEQMARESEAPF